MLGKVAEMLALRRSFPMELSGLYSSEEMSQAETIDVPVAAKSTQASVVTAAISDGYSDLSKTLLIMWMKKEGITFLTQQEKDLGATMHEILCKAKYSLEDSKAMVIDAVKVFKEKNDDGKA
jgi:hypothetical protein